MNVAADQFLESLRQTSDLPHAVIIWGDEDYYKKAGKAALGKLLKEKADAEGQEVSVWRFQDKFEINALREAINTESFFGGINFVLVENPWLLPKHGAGEQKGKKKSTGGKTDKGQTAVQQFMELLSDVPAYTFVLCLCPKLDKRSAFFKNMSKAVVLAECPTLKAYQLRPWLLEQANSYGARFSPEALNLVLNYVSAFDTVPLLQLQQEIAKVNLYAGQRKIWQAEDVLQMFSQAPEISGFALGNAVEERNLTKVLDLLAEERKNAGSGGIVPIQLRLVSSIRKLLLVKEMMEKGARQETITAQLKMHPYAVKVTMAHCNNFSLESLQKCMVALAQTAADSRQGGRTWSRLEEILIDLVAKK